MWSKKLITGGTGSKKRERDPRVDPCQTGDATTPVLTVASGFTMLGDPSGGLKTGCNEQDFVLCIIFRSGKHFMSF